MKNKFLYVILILYLVLYMICLFSYDYITNINIAIANLLSSNMERVQTLYHVFYEIECAIFYVGLGIVVTITSIEFNDKIKYIVLFSFLISLLLCVIALVIKSYKNNLNLIDSIIIFISIIIGVIIELLVKIKQVRNE